MRTGHTVSFCEDGTFKVDGINVASVDEVHAILDALDDLEDSKRAKVDKTNWKREGFWKINVMFIDKFVLIKEFINNDVLSNEYTITSCSFSKRKNTGLICIKHIQVSYDLFICFYSDNKMWIKINGKISTLLHSLEELRNAINLQLLRKQTWDFYLVYYIKQFL